jgi:RNA polymerase sigma factor (sigma-70 family)
MGDTERRGTAALYEEQRERILAMCTAMLHDRADAEDAVQETFARAGARLDSLDGDPVAYLFVVARNVCRDELRRRCRAAAPAGASELHEDDAVERTAVDRSLLRRAWADLPAQERSVLAAVFSGWSTAEIARGLGLSVNAAAQRISRARRHARRVIAAPAMVLLATRTAVRLRRLGRLPTDALAVVVGGGQEAERWAAPLLLAVIFGMLGGGTAAPSPRAPAVPSAIASLPAVPAAGAVTAMTHASVVNAATAMPAAAPTQPAGASLAAQPPALVGNRVVSFTASPDYAHDHTVYASTRPQSCQMSCSGLFRSNDGGRTWESLGGAGLIQGTVLLPPTFPRDPTLYAISPGVALLRSRDGGAHFETLLPVAPTMAAIDPTSPPGGVRIWVLLQSMPALLVWDESDGMLHPVIGLPADTDAVATVFAVAGSPVVYVNVVEAVNGTSLWACDSATACHRAGPATGAVPVTAPGASDTFFVPHLGSVEVRSVSGTPDRTIDLGLGAIVEAILPAVDYAHSGQFDVVAYGGITAGGGARFTVQRFLANALGAPRRAWSPPLDGVLLQRLADGHLLAALGPLGGSGTDASGLLCSADDGGTWQPRC